MSELEAPSTKLGRLRPIAPREVWPHEARNFTLWLLNNADVLSDALGMQLELTEAEHTVGGFSLDLIGKDLATDETVIVENQLERTDHAHLGQLLTYAGGTDAVNVVWCAPSFREEHRAALDWLNTRTDEDTRFFGVEIAVVRIDDSRPAPSFRLVVQPNDWSKQVHAGSADTVVRGKRLAYSEFWSSLLDRIRTERPSWTSATRAPADSWITLPFGSSAIWYSMAFTTRGLMCELYFGSPDAEANATAFAEYEALRAQIERDFGETLSFEPLPDKKACRIAAYLPGGDVTDTSKHVEYADWLMETHERFRAAIEAARNAIATERPVASGLS
jgi:hypothetical protein